MLRKVKIAGKPGSPFGTDVQSSGLRSWGQSLLHVPEILDFREALTEESFCNFWGTTLVQVCQFPPSGSVICRMGFFGNPRVFLAVELLVLIRNERFWILGSVHCCRCAGTEVAFMNQCLSFNLLGVWSSWMLP